MSRGYPIVDYPAVNAVVPTSLWTAYTPILMVAGGGTAPTYTVISGRYGLVNNSVFCDITLNGNGGTPGSGSGQFSISLPVQVGSHVVTHDQVLCGYMLNNSTYWHVVGTLVARAISLPLSKLAFNGVFSIVSGGDQNNATRTMELHFSYEVEELDPTYSTTTSTGLQASFGTAAFLNTGTGPNSVVQLTGAGKLPAVDGSLLTNVTGIQQSSIRKVINQVNTFTSGTPIRFNGSLWVTAQADSAVDADVQYVVESATGTSFVAVRDGDITLSGLTQGQYYLDPTTAGGITQTKPTVSGQVAKPILWATSATTAIVGIQLGILL